MFGILNPFRIDLAVRQYLITPMFSTLGIFELGKALNISSG